MSTLSDLHVGESGRATSLPQDDRIRRRLIDMGLVVGTEVTCLGTAPSGDPKAYLIRDTVIALRRKEAEQCAVNPAK